MNNDDVVFFGRTNFRDKSKVFGIRRNDRRSHLHVIGKTGSGKSSLLETFIYQDINNGEGLVAIDPHGESIERIVSRIPEHRRNDVIYFNVPDRSLGHFFNPLEQVPSERRSLVASGLLETFMKLWTDAWGARMEYILRNAIHALLDYPGAKLSDILRLFRDKSFRQDVGAHAKSEEVRIFWMKDFEAYSWRYRAEAIAPIQNKVGSFLADPILHRIFSQPQSSFFLRRVMDEGKILLVNLAKGKIGEDSAALLGALLISKIQTIGLSRADLPEEQRKDFFVYIDEFHTFTTRMLANMLAELRKYRVNLILAHQYLSQLDVEVRDSLFANVGTIISFRVGLPDAKVIEKEFFPAFRAEDLINLPNYNIYLKMMIDGQITKPFSAETLRVEDL